jgi:hypothetical protein
MGCDLPEKIKYAFHFRKTRLFGFDICDDSIINAQREGHDLVKIHPCPEPERSRQNWQAECGHRKHLRFEYIPTYSGRSSLSTGGTSPEKMVRMLLFKLNPSLNGKSEYSIDEKRTASSRVNKRTAVLAHDGSDFAHSNADSPCFCPRGEVQTDSLQIAETAATNNYHEISQREKFRGV